jgi:hypothetical protein
MSRKEYRVLIEEESGSEDGADEVSIHSHSDSDE